MGYKEIVYRMAFLLPTGGVSRIETMELADGDVRVTVDVHGLTVAQARRLLNNIIAMIRRPFSLEIIHGYHHGTAIRDMIYTDYHNPKMISRHINMCNPGITLAEIA